MEHLFKYQCRDREEDHLAKAAFGLIALMFYDEHMYPDDWTVSGRRIMAEEEARPKTLVEVMQHFSEAISQAAGSMSEIDYEARLENHVSEAKEAPITGCFDRAIINALEEERVLSEQQRQPVLDD
jgi:hypothetical protein